MKNSPYFCYWSVFNYSAVINSLLPVIREVYQIVCSHTIIPVHLSIPCHSGLSFHHWFTYITCRSAFHSHQFNHLSLIRNTMTFNAEFFFFDFSSLNLLLCQILNSCIRVLWIRLTQTSEKEALDTITRTRMTGRSSRWLRAMSTKKNMRCSEKWDSACGNRVV